MRHSLFLKDGLMVYQRHSVLFLVTAELISISAVRSCLMWHLLHDMSYSPQLPLMMKNILGRWMLLSGPRPRILFSTVKRVLNISMNLARVIPVCVKTYPTDSPIGSWLGSAPTPYAALGDRVVRLSAENKEFLIGSVSSNFPLATERAVDS